MAPIDDFKYFNLQLQILQLKDLNTSKSTSTNIVIITVTTRFVQSTFVHTTFDICSSYNCTAYFGQSFNGSFIVAFLTDGLGTTILGIPVAGVGQADNTALVSSDLHQLQCLLDLSLEYCKKHQVQLSAVKTKLMIFCNKETEYTRYSRMISPLSIGNTPVQFATTAEHVGVLRSVSGNLPHLQQRIVSHRRSLAQILSMHGHVQEAPCQPHCCPARQEHLYDAYSVLWCRLSPCYQV